MSARSVGLSWSTGVRFWTHSLALLYYGTHQVLARPASEPTASRGRKNDEDEDSFQLKGVTSKDEDVQLGILVFALMVVAIAVSLALMIVTCVLKARTRQRDEMEARVEELELILIAKAEAMRDDQNPEPEGDIASEKERSGTISSPSEDMHDVAQSAGGNSITCRPGRSLPPVPSESMSSDVPPYTHIRGHGISMPPDQIPLPDSVPSYDHSRGEAFTSSPQTFSTPMAQSMQVNAQAIEDYHLAQGVSEAIADQEEMHCPPNVAWLADVLVDSPQPDSGRPAKTDVCEKHVVA